MKQIFNKYQKWLAFFIALLFFFYAYFNRLMFGGIVPTFMHTFKVSITDVGILSASLYFIFAFLQIPAGLILDRFNLKYVLSFTAFFSSIGSILLSFSSSFYEAFFARIMTGMGSAFAFLACLKIADLYFSRAYSGILSGVILFVGTLGAVCSEAPFHFLEAHLGLRASFFCLGFFGLIIAFLLFFLVLNSKPSFSLPENIQHQLLHVIKKKANLLLALLSVCITTPLSIFLATWGGEFLAVKFHVTMQTAATMLSSCLVMALIGSIIVNGLANNSFQRILILLSCIFLSFISCIILIYWDITFAVAYLLLLILGFSSAAIMIPFTLATAINDSECIATTNGLINAGMMFSSGLGQVLVGIALQKLGHGAINIHSYQIVLFIMPLLYLLAFFIILSLVNSRFFSSYNKLT